MSLLEIRNLEFSYPGKDESLFGGLSFTLSEGQITCVLGLSGCGKTTLLNIAAGFRLPKGGEVRFKGVPVTKPEISRVMVFQDYSQLFPWKTAIKNVMFPMIHKNEARARKLLSLSGLDSEYEKYPAELSGGMKQRVAIARALAAEPELLLLDEPFDGLDAPTRRSLQNTLLNLEEEMRVTLLMVTHDIDEAVYLSDQIIILGRGGRIVNELENPLPLPRIPHSNSYLDFKQKLYSSIEGERTL